MSDKLFNTIYGRGLMGELKNIVQRPYLVVTMEDLWDIFKDEFDEDAVVHFVKTLEYKEIMAEIDAMPRFESVIGLGGGQAVDYAKNGSLEKASAALSDAHFHCHQCCVWTQGRHPLRQQCPLCRICRTGCGLHRL